VPSPVVAKIKDVLNFIRNEFLEVPFIAFYRKEYIYTDVNKINKNTDLELPDLWKIYEMDEKYCQLKNRKENFIKLVERMRHYQGELLKELKTKRYVRVR
jgi:transcription elongation factor SPT6